MATDLDTHTPSSRRAKEDYEESFCPICLGAQASQASEHTETMVHFLWECEHLHTEQKALDETLATFVQSAGGIPIKEGSEALRQWKDLPQNAKLGLLMGNHIPDINTLSKKYEVIQQWLTRFLEAADAPLLTLWTLEKTSKASGPVLPRLEGLRHRSHIGEQTSAPRLKSPPRRRHIYTYSYTYPYDRERVFQCRCYNKSSRVFTIIQHGTIWWNKYTYPHTHTSDHENACIHKYTYICVYLHIHRQV
jgi:hypothetical protein